VTHANHGRDVVALGAAERQTAELFEQPEGEFSALAKQA